MEVLTRLAKYLSPKKMAGLEGTSEEALLELLLTLAYDSRGHEPDAEYDYRYAGRELHAIDLAR